MTQPGEAQERHPAGAVQTPKAEMVYHGNVRSLKLHQPGC